VRRSGIVRGIVVVGAVVAGAVGGVACNLTPLGPREVTGPRALGAAPALPAPMLVAEHAGRGGHLAFVDERGRRVRSLTAPPEDEASVDVTPVFSPDLRNVIFSSTRGRVGRAGALVVLALDGRSPPRALTTPDEGIDFQPALSPDGRQLAYTSAHGASHAVFVLALDGDLRPAGPPRLLAEGALRPAWSHRGDRVVYTRQPSAASSPEIWVCAADGSRARKVVDGNAASFAPDDRRLVLTATAPQRSDGDLWLIDADGGAPVRLVDDANGDEGAPRFSADGRFVFAESVVRDAQGKAVYPSIVYVDLAEAPPRLRALADRNPAGWTSLALAPVALDGAALDAGPGYAEALARAAISR
jgi:dipeptidyl aminopeptidase/acylaminoacyl peptidase